MTDNFQRPYSQEHIIKQWVDECTGKFIDPITVTDAVITKHGKTLTEVLDLIFGNLRQNKDLLNDLKIRIEDLERYKERFETLSWEFKALQTKVNAFPDTYATKASLECLRSTLEALSHQLNSNNALFTQLLAYLMGQGGQSGQGGQGGTIDIGDLAGYLRRDELLSAIDELHVFTKNIRSELTETTYAPVNGLTTLPPTVGGAFYVGDTDKSGERFYFALNGDVNGDGYVTAADITALYEWLLDNNNEHLVNPDVFPDGHITAADITKVYDILLNGPQPVIKEKTTGNMYWLPIGTIFVNKDRVYKVIDTNLSGIVGELYSQNSNYFSQNAPSNTYNTFNGPGIRPKPQNPSEMVASDFTDVEEVHGEARKEFDSNKFINTLLVAAATRESNESVEDRLAVIDEAVEEGTFNKNITNFKDIPINLNWNGSPQKTAQGLVFLKDGNIQYVEPLGSFMDFKRITSDTRTKYVDVVLFGNNVENEFDTVATRFEVKPITTAIPSATEDANFGTVYAENEANGLVFCWIGAHPTFKEKPVVLPTRDFTDYFNYANRIVEGN